MSVQKKSGGGYVFLIFVKMAFTSFFHKGFQLILAGAPLYKVHIFSTKDGFDFFTTSADQSGQVKQSLVISQTFYQPTKNDHFILAE